jgi:hypothetical protein
MLSICSAWCFGWYGLWTRAFIVMITAGYPAYTYPAYITVFFGPPEPDGHYQVALGGQSY